jgi:hypothetical protein
MQVNPNRALGAFSILLALSYNALFSVLATIFDYPDILRQPAAIVLSTFTTGGSALILTWYLFALTAVAFVPISIALAFARNALSPWTITAAIFGALAGMAQAIGLLRWAFAIPAVAASQDPAAPLMFEMLNTYGGVAIGEHLGQALTAMYLIAMGQMALLNKLRTECALAWVSAAIILIGSQEAVALALGRDTGVLPMFSVAGYIGLSLWLFVIGLRLIMARETR